jgi:molybdopterin-guanine dinucleotide biosynthesis protein A
MKTIVISGASSGVGKTTLANTLTLLLEGSVVVKIGHHSGREGHGRWLYPMGTMFSRMMLDHQDARFLIIESNSILREITPDFCIYLDGENPKPSALLAGQRANMRRGERCSAHAIAATAKRLEIPQEVVRRIAWLAGARPEPFSIAILAGGQSSRMGCDKALLDIDGRPAVGRLHSMVQQQCDRVFISTKASSAPLFADFDTIIDREEGKGPLMGILSVLAATESDLTGIIACDIPQVDPNLFPLLCSWIGDADIAVPTLNGATLEPLMAIYRKSVFSRAEEALAQGNLRVTDLFRKCRTVIVCIQNAGWYFNINTPQDYGRFCATLGR